MKIGERIKKDDDIEEEQEETEELQDKETDKQEEYDDYNKNTEIIVEDYEKGEDDTKSFFKSSERKKLVILMGAIFGLLLLLLLFLYFASILSVHSYTYEEVENIMNQAANNYFSKHLNALPQEDGSAVEIDTINLSTAGEMDDLSEYIKNEVCTGSVIVERINSRYIYFPRLSCGNNYMPIEFYKKVIDKGTVSSGYGLYFMNSSYIFRGEKANNYVQLGSNVWRIVKITSSNKVVLVSTNVLGEENWDDRYNLNLKENIGINNYSNSRIKEFLDNVSFSDEILDKILPFNLCIGKKSINSTRNDNSEECTEAVRNQFMGLLTVSDYVTASIDSNCKNISSKSCQNYNYLNGGVDVWLATADKDSSYKAYCVLQDGTVTLKNTNENAYVRPIIYLNSKVLYKSGNGTFDDPYVLK